jgi:NTP pyrophosphatase (non-canonical NTP hydrolase)
MPRRRVLASGRVRYYAQAHYNHKNVHLGAFDSYQDALKEEHRHAETRYRKHNVHMTQMLQEYIDSCRRDSNRWFPIADQDRLIVNVLGLIGESGEVVDELKKLIRGSQSYTEFAKRVEVELIDVFIYWCNLIDFLKVDVAKVYEAKREYNEQRFG